MVLNIIYIFLSGAVLFIIGYLGTQKIEHLGGFHVTKRKWALYGALLGYWIAVVINCLRYEPSILHILPMPSTVFLSLFMGIAGWLTAMGQGY